MRLSALVPPETDPTSIFELFRGNYSTELLAAATAHFNVFGRLAERPVSIGALRQLMGLAERPAQMLVTALQAMGLLASDAVGNLHLTPLAREHLVSGAPFDVSDYVALASNSPAVLEMVERMTTNSPAGKKDDEQGAAFIYRQGQPSAMEKEESARHFTLALAGRAKNVAPYLARQAPLRKTAVLLDVGGGTGIYSIACLQKHPQLRAIIWDRREVLKVASEMAVDYGVADRVELRTGDMFADSVPMADTILLSNILHDWDVPECRQLIGRCSAALPVGGQLLIHDVFLNDSLDGPLAVALYSAALFCVTEGRAYSAAEYRGWLREAGLEPAQFLPTLVHCGILPAVKL